MNISMLDYYIKEGIKGLYKNQKSMIGSLITMCATLFIFGVFILLSINTQDFVRKLETEQGISVFLEYDTEQDKVKELREKILEFDGVNVAEIKTREEAFEEMKKNFADSPSILTGIDSGTLLPDAIVVKLTDLSKASEVKSEIEKLDNILRINDEKETINLIVGFSNIINSFNFILTVILVIVSVLIISNTIKLSVFARRKEIGIMKYVGATNTFIKGPFIVEGVSIGILATIITLLIISGVYEYVVIQIATQLQNAVSNLDATSTMTLNLVSLKEVLPILAVTYLVIGAGLGAIGSSLSMKKHLDV